MTPRTWLSEDLAPLPSNGPTSGHLVIEQAEFADVVVCTGTDELRPLAHTGAVLGRLATYVRFKGGCWGCGRGGIVPVRPGDAAGQLRRSPHLAPEVAAWSWGSRTCP